VSTESTGAPPPQLSGSTDNTVQRSLDDYETLLRNKAANNKSEDEDGQ
jgi:hypothetical protein